MLRFPSVPTTPAATCGPIVASIPQSRVRMHPFAFMTSSPLPSESPRRVAAQDSAYPTLLNLRRSCPLQSERWPWRSPSLLPGGGIPMNTPLAVRPAEPPKCQDHAAGWYVYPANRIAKPRSLARREHCALANSVLHRIDNGAFFVLEVSSGICL